MSRLAKFNGIDSLIMEEDAELLRRYAGQVAADGLCVEMGSFQGASAYSILQGLPDRYDLACCSLFWADEYSKFRQFMLREKLWHRIIPVTGDYHLLWDRVKQGPIAFAFIDHDHTEQGMQDAIDLLLPHCVKDSIIMFHDYGHPGYPAVKQYVDTLDQYAFQRLHLKPLMAVLKRV